MATVSARARLAPRAVALAAVVLAAGCAPVMPKGLLGEGPASLAQRQLQTRRFETSEEPRLLEAGAAVLQDLGFTIEASAADLGLIVAAKDLSAEKKGQKAAAVTIFILTAILSRGQGAVDMPVDVSQKMRVSLVTRPSGQEADATLVRVTFQRIVLNSHKQERYETLSAPALYQEFFDKLSKAVFLDAHDI